MNAIIDHQRQSISAVTQQVAAENVQASKVGPREIRMLLSGEDERKESKPVPFERRNA